MKKGTRQRMQLLLEHIVRCGSHTDINVRTRAIGILREMDVAEATLAAVAGVDEPAQLPLVPIDEREPAKVPPAFVAADFARTESRIARMYRAMAYHRSWADATSRVEPPPVGAGIETPIFYERILPDGRRSLTTDPTAEVAGPSPTHAGTGEPDHADADRDRHRDEHGAVLAQPSRGTAGAAG